METQGTANFIGKIIEIGLSGHGSITSGQITFVVRNNEMNEDKAFNINADQSPLVFWAMESALTAAYFTNSTVEVGFYTPIDQTSNATSVKIAHYLT
jgi:hypothetical protein